MIFGLVFAFGDFLPSGRYEQFGIGFTTFGDNFLDLIALSAVFCCF